MSRPVEIAPAHQVEAERIRRFLVRVWHAEFIVAHGERIRPLEMDGYAALADGVVVGHAAYRFDGDACELTAIAADPPGRGIGGRLLDRVVDAARVAGCSRVWLTTTNDNVDALRFYQRRGFRLAALRVGAIDEARRDLKPELPEIGSHGIPMRDELDLELRLT
jgi:ribosomal protein S18 acetylase RimI-like enzyme